jgi:ribokinase
MLATMSRLSRSPRILIVGSVNMDVVVRTRRSPRGGETVIGDHLSLVPGGKGANQAVATARLGGHASFVGRVGDDVWGAELSSKLRESGVDTTWLEVDATRPTGTATIIVEADGENRIVLIGGANDEVSPDQVDAALDERNELDALLLQLEIPLETVYHAIQRGKERGIPVVLDAGPPQAVPLERLRGVTVLSPNESEAEALTGIAVDDDASARRAAQQLDAATGARHVVLKLGNRGAMMRDDGEYRVVPAYDIDAVDTTAAGDSFTAALTIELARDRPLAEAVAWSNAAGALAATRLGAQPSLPTRAEVESFVETRS